MFIYSSFDSRHKVCISYGSTSSSGPFKLLETDILAKNAWELYLTVRCRVGDRPMIGRIDRGADSDVDRILDSCYVSSTLLYRFQKTLIERI